jgi:hypothetical protein
MHRVQKAEYLEGYKILLTFENEQKKIVDFQEALDNFEGTIFKPLKDLEYFKSFNVSIGTVVWPNDADVSPEYLYEVGKKP